MGALSKHAINATCFRRDAQFCRKLRTWKLVPAIHLFLTTQLIVLMLSWFEMLSVPYFRSAWTLDVVNIPRLGVVKYPPQVIGAQHFESLTMQVPLLLTLHMWLFQELSFGRYHAQVHC